MNPTTRLPGRVRFVDSVVLRLGPERGFLFDQRTGRVYSLNASGVLAAQRIQEGIPVPVVIAAVEEAFEVDAITLRRDFTRFVAHLVEEGLAETDG
ncbi:MAG: PqqD family protein [Candidatus Methylomirabilia bacterium]